MAALARSPVQVLKKDRCEPLEKEYTLLPKHLYQNVCFYQETQHIKLEQDVMNLIHDWNVILFQLPPYHEAAQAITLLNERLIILLYCLNKGKFDCLFEELKILFDEPLLRPKVDVLTQKQYPSVVFNDTVKEFISKQITYEDNVIARCYYLGVTSEVCDDVKGIGTRFQYHFSFKIWVMKFFDSNCFDFLLNGEEELATSLNKIGYTKEKSEYIVSLIDENLLHLQSPRFWALRYLSNSFYYDMLLLHLPKFPFQSEKVNEFFERYCDYDDEDNGCKKVKMMNVSNVEAEKEIVLPMLTNSDEFVFLYHATTFTCCLDLILNGIFLCGSPAQDFSSLDGFYLSEDLEDAKRWGSAGRGDSYAVLVYKVRRDLVDAEKQHGLNLTDYTQWNRVVKYCRSEYKLELDPPINLENVSFIRGPTAAGQAFLDGELGRDFTMGDSIQICLKEKMFAKELGNIDNIFGVLFY